MAMSDKQKKKIKKVFDEYKAGTLKSSSGEKITSYPQAVAIAMSEANVKKKKEN